MHMSRVLEAGILVVCWGSKFQCQQKLLSLYLVFRVSDLQNAAIVYEINYPSTKLGEIIPIRQFLTNFMSPQLLVPASLLSPPSMPSLLSPQSPPLHIFVILELNLVPLIIRILWRILKKEIGEPIQCSLNLPLTNINYSVVKTKVSDNIIQI